MGGTFALAVSSACKVTDQWFSPRFFILAEFCMRRWIAEVFLR